MDTCPSSLQWSNLGCTTHEICGEKKKVKSHNKNEINILVFTRQLCRVFFLVVFTTDATGIERYGFLGNSLSSKLENKSYIFLFYSLSYSHA
jgi:hypothetical protein